MEEGWRIASSREDSAQRPHLVRKAGGVLRPGQFLFESVQAEAVMDARVQDAAQLAVVKFLCRTNDVFKGLLALFQQV